MLGILPYIFFKKYFTTVSVDLVYLFTPRDTQMHEK
jgi:hypothetical protein